MPDNARSTRFPAGPLKVSAPPSHSVSVVARALAASSPSSSPGHPSLLAAEIAPTSEAPREEARPSGEQTVPLDFAAVYDRWFEHVCRWLSAFGIPHSDREDLAQEVFLVVQRQLGEFEGKNLSGWLYGIARRTASDHRRRSWFKNLFRRRVDFVWETAPDAKAGPDAVCEQRDAIRAVGALLGRMDETRRAAFILFEIEGYSGEEIAAFEGVPLATVWTRLHYARKEFQRLSAESEGAK